MSMVNTVRKNYEVFTSAEIKRADSAYKTLGRLGNPAVDNFENMVCANKIQNCPIAFKYVTNTKVIFCTHLVGASGKTVINTSKQMDSDRVAIPRYFKLLNKSVSLVADVLFVNGIPFLITLFRNLLFVTAKHMKYRTSNKLSGSMNKSRIIIN